jgi:hypothetical protein
MKAIAKFAGMLLAGAAMHVCAAEGLSDFMVRLEIKAQDKASWYQADVPVSVRWHAKHFDLRDLRVFNADGEPLPFALTTSSAQLVRDRREAAARFFPLYALNIESEPDVTLGGSVRVRRDVRGNVEIEALPGTHTPAVRKQQKVLRGWLVDASAADFPLERLELDWAPGEQEGFFRFSIEASDDLEHWNPWGGGQLVRLNFDGQSILQREISLPGRKARYLRLIWEDAQTAPGVRGARVSGEVAHTGEALLAWSPPIAGEPVPGEEREFVWHLPSSLSPQRVRVVLEEDNVLAPVVFYGRNVQPAAPESARSGEGGGKTDPNVRSDRRRLRDVVRGSRHTPQRTEAKLSPSETPWQPLANGVLYRLPENQGKQMENELDLPSFPVNQLRLRVDQRGGGLGRSAPRIELALRNSELTFLARGNAPYWLAVGNADARAADLPLGTLIPGGIAQAQRTGQLGRAHILEGGLIANAPDPVPQLAPDASTGSASPPQIDESKRTVLWAVLTAGVLLLAAMAYSLARSMKKEREANGLELESERKEY